MSESNPHAGTGAYICDACGQRFSWTKHGESGYALMNIERHACPGRMQDGNRRTR